MLLIDGGGDIQLVWVVEIKWHNISATSVATRYRLKITRGKIVLWGHPLLVGNGSFTLSL